MSILEAEKKSKSGNMFARFRKDQSGVTAIEFAMLLPIFLVMIFSMIEMGAILTKRALLDSAASEVSRSIYTGAAANGEVDKEELETEICRLISIIDDDCEDNLVLEVTEITDFTAIPTSDAVCHESDEAIKPAVSFESGSAKTIMYMRICLSTPVFVPTMGLGLNMTKTDSGNFQIVSALAFANEPF